MKSSVEKLNETSVKLNVEVPFAELDKQFDQAYKALAQQVSIPGFRRGKAPRKLLEARIGRGYVVEQVINEALPEYYGKAVEENELRVLGQPEIEVTNAGENDKFEFVATCSVRPEFEVPDFSTFEVEVPALSVTEEDVDKELDQLRTRFATLKDVDRAAQKDDFVELDLSATVDGETIDEATAEGMSHQVGSGDLIDGMDEAIEGLKAGESGEFTTTLPGGEHEGEEATVTVKVTAVKERELPEVDEDFAQMASEFDTVEELRADLKEKVEEEKKSGQAIAIRDEVLKQSLEAAQFPLPERLVDEQVDGQLQQLLQQFGNDENLLNSMLEAQGTSREEFDKNSRSSAEEAVRTQIFLDAVAEIEEPTVGQQDLSDHIMFTARNYGMEPQQFVQQLQQTGQFGNLIADVRRGKALAQAICKVSVKDSEGNKVDPAEYFGEDEEENTEE